MLLNGLPKGGLLLAGLAAFAYYKYSKMTPEQKKSLVDKIKGQGKKIYDQFMPTNGKPAFAKTNQ